MKESTRKHLWLFIWRFLKNYKRFVIPFLILTTIIGMWSPINNFLMKYIIDTLSSHPTKEIGSLIFWPAVFIVFNFQIGELCWRGIAYLNYKFEPVIKNQIITETFQHVLKSSHQFFLDNFSGRISSQVSILAGNIEYIVHILSMELIRGIVLLFLAFISLYIIDAKFFLSLLVWFIVFIFFSLAMSKQLIRLSESEADAETHFYGQLVDSITNNQNVRIFSKRLYEISHLQKSLNSMKTTFQAKQWFAMKLHFTQGISLSIMLSVILFFLIQLKIQNKISIGDFSLVLSMTLDASFMTWSVVGQIDELNKASGRCKQSLNALFLPLEIQDKPNASQLIVTEGSISFIHVDFQYKKNEPLFKNLSIHIKPGQKTGLVGYSGSGKTTFVNLVLRLYEVTKGKIIIDGQDIREVTQESLYDAIGMIPQDPVLFHRTILENIRYGHINASEAEIIEAAKQAHAHEFIIKLPQGYETLVGERGIKLSGGQRQRIAIARIILKNAPILILDEATSQLDSLTEKYIQSSLWNLMQNKTTLVIAHRLSTLLKMDRILVFDKGKIIEDGTHETLLASGGLYQTLWKTQAGGFLSFEKQYTHST